MATFVIIIEYRKKIMSYCPKLSFGKGFDINIYRFLD